MRLLGLFLCLAAGSAWAGEYAVLASGSRLHADRHETDGGKVRLYTGGGYIELDAAQVRSFESETPAAPAVSQPGPSTASAAVTPTQLADAAADRYGLPRRLVRSVMAAESAFRPDAVSPKGAIGLMQLMPSTARILGVDPKDPAQNVDAGARYLRSLLERYNGYLWQALAAYNAGEAAVEKYKGIPPFRETINYVYRIDKDLKKGD
jgi:soluble lytic murein transglycosylase-like protein